MRFPVIALLSVFSIGPLGALAQGSCPEAPMIRSLAQTILEGRVDLPGLRARHIGAEAAYLEMHYGQLTDAEALALVSPFIGQSMPGGTDLAVALTVSVNGAEAGLALIDADPVRAFAMAGPSTRRAVLLADTGKTYFELLAMASARPELDGLLIPQSANALDLLGLVSDQPDDALRTLASAAEDAGFLLGAGQLFAALPDLELFHDFLNRNAAAEAIVEYGDSTASYWSIATLPHGTGPIRDANTIADPALTPDQRGVYAVQRMSYLSGPADFSGMMLNQTFWTQEGEAVAAAYLAEVAEGRIDPVRDPESAWLFQYRAWVALKGREAVHSVLPYYDFPSQRLRHFAGSAVVSLDWMIAKEALRPYLTGATATVPTRPALLSDGFDWTRWMTAAEVVRSDDPSALLTDDAELAIIVTELLADIGNLEMMAAVAPQALEGFEKLNFFRDVMQRLDRRCDAITAQPGQAFLLGGDVIFRL
jgi:hypothetical protein